MSYSDLFEGLNFYIFPTGRATHVQALIRFIEERCGAVIDRSKERIKEIEYGDMDGYALIDPSQTYAYRLLGKEPTEHDGGVLYFVHWGFPDLCAWHKEIVDVEDAKRALALSQGPINSKGYVFAFSRDLLENDEETCNRLRRTITRAGGQVTEHQDEASILVAAEKNLLAAQRSFETQKCRVVSVSWLRDSVSNGYMSFKSSPKPMGGRIPYSEGGKRRKQFNSADRKTLMKFLASNSSKSGKGRQGNLIYKQLCEECDREDRHTWQSWRSHYKGNKEFYDEWIEQYRKEKLVHQDRIGRDPRTRRANARFRDQLSDQEDAEATTDDEIELTPAAHPVGRRRLRKLRSIEMDKTIHAREDTEEEAMEEDQGSFDDYQDEGQYEQDDSNEYTASRLAGRPSQATLVGVSAGTQDFTHSPVSNGWKALVQSQGRDLYDMESSEEEEEEEAPGFDDVDLGDEPLMEEAGSDNPRNEGLHVDKEHTEEEEETVASDKSDEERVASKAPSAPMPHLDFSNFRKTLPRMSNPGPKKTPGTTPTSQSRRRTRSGRGFQEDESIPAREFVLGGNVRRSGSTSVTASARSRGAL